jgi:hypothetical protein
MNGVFRVDGKLSPTNQIEFIVRCNTISIRNEIIFKQEFDNPPYLSVSRFSSSLVG